MTVDAGSTRRSAAVRDVVARALAEDLGRPRRPDRRPGPRGRHGRRRPRGPRGRGAGRPAGRRREPSRRSTRRSRCAWAAADGDRARRRARSRPGATVRWRSVLTAERTALNLLGHLSGVATLTRRFVDAAGRSARASATPARPRPGCGPSRRPPCAPAAASTTAARSPTASWSRTTTSPASPSPAAVAEARPRWPGPGLRGRVRHPRAGQGGRSTPAPTWSCSTTWTPPRWPPPSRLVGGRVPVEVSGGVTLDKVAAYAAAGADLISVGALTHSAPVLDIGLDLER